MDKYAYYETNHDFSRYMGDHAHQGFSAKKIPLSTGSYHYGFTSMVYGILRGTGKILTYCDKNGFDYIYIDHSYFFNNRGYVDGDINNPAYFRFVKNDRYWGNSAQMPSDRLKKLNLQILPWKKGGDMIIVVPMSRFIAQYNKVDANKWMNDILSILSQYTDKNLVVKPKSNGAVEGLDELYSRAWALVTADSTAAISALASGIPCFTSSQNPASLLSLQDITSIEEPFYPDNRVEHFSNLAYQQFTQREIADGTAKGILECL